MRRRGEVKRRKRGRGRRRDIEGEIWAEITKKEER